MLLRQLFDRESSTYTYLIADPRTRAAVLVDPVKEQLERDLSLLSELGLKLTLVLDTHVHADHVTAAGDLRARTGAMTAASSIGAPCVDRPLADGETLHLGALQILVLATPGHTDDGLTFLVEGHALTGDTLLIRGCGRTDFQNGDAGTLYDSITQRLFTLPDHTVVLPGHDYRGFTRSTIGEERRSNPRIAARTREQFIELMANLQLAAPAQLERAVAMNRSCGQEAQGF